MRRTLGEFRWIRFAGRGCSVAAVMAFTLAACGGGSGGTTAQSSTPATNTGGTGATNAPSGQTSAGGVVVASQSPAITNTIASGVFTRWIEGTVNPNVVVGSAGNQTILASPNYPNDPPVWTGTAFVAHAMYTPYARPGAPNWNALQGTMPYLSSSDGINWTAAYTTIPNPLGAGNYMEVQHIASDGKGVIAAYGIDVAESSTIGEGELFVAFADVATMTWRVALLGVKSTLSAPLGEGVSYAYGRWYVSYPAASSDGITSAYIESADGIAWQPSGARSVRFLSNFKGDALYRSERATSTDLITWMPYAPAADPRYTYSTPNTNSSISNSKAIVFTPVGKTLGAGTTPVRGSTLVSLDGKTWLEGVINGSASVAFTCSDRLFMAQYGYGTALAFLSDDGLNWTQTTLPTLTANAADPAAGEYYLTGGCLPAIGRAFLFTRGLPGNRIFYSG